jgi:hypothetical protein
MSEIPLSHRFEDSGVFFHRTSWDAGSTAFALKAGPPEGHRTTRLLSTVPEWQLSSGHAHPDAGSFIIRAGGRYLRRRHGVRVAAPGAAPQHDHGGRRRPRLRWRSK